MLAQPAAVKPLRHSVRYWLASAASALGTLMSAVLAWSALRGAHTIGLGVVLAAMAAAGFTTLVSLWRAGAADNRRQLRPAGLALVAGFVASVAALVVTLDLARRVIEYPLAAVIFLLAVASVSVAYGVAVLLLLGLVPPPRPHRS